jgi:hypothetical protein
MTEHDRPIEASSDRPPRFADLAADALRYWEPRRLLYNLVLAAVVVIHFVAAWPGSRIHLNRDTFFGVFLLAVVANILYCAAYAVDVFVQFSGVRGEWRRLRWILLLTGTAFAAVITHFMSMAILGSGMVD